MPINLLTIPLLSFLLLAPLGALAEGQRVEFLGFHSQVPSRWAPEPPTSSMRVLQLKVPGAEGAESAALIVYFFGPGQGGTVEANVERWKSQFSGPDGSPVVPSITSVEGSQLPATLVELEGSYARGIGVGPSGEAQSDRMLLAAVVETPKGNLYPQLHGPAELVKSQRADFIAFLKGIATDSSP
jgi:hypothetical protein